MAVGEPDNLGNVERVGCALSLTHQFLSLALKGSSASFYESRDFLERFDRFNT